MSAGHCAVLERISIEHQEAVRLLTAQARSSRQQRTPHKDPSTGAPLSKSALYEAAVATANDAYALLLIATAEGFMRAYLRSLGVELGRDPKLTMLIDRSRKEFNKRTSRSRIHPSTVAAVHNLREQRNSFAHGRGPGVFPTVDKVARILGRFFAGIP